ncbi:MAG: hypothetical protein U0792_24885 [Gemmataceae bacterium]
MSSSSCPECGKEAPPEVVTCPSCGHAQTAVAAHSPDESGKMLQTVWLVVMLFSVAGIAWCKLASRADQPSRAGDPPVTQQVATNPH